MSNCKNICKLCPKLIISSAISYNAPNLQISIPEGSYYDDCKYCIVTAQSIPAETPVDAPVVISIVNGTQVYPLVACDCEPITARAIRSRTKYSTVVKTDTTTGVFRLLGKICKCNMANSRNALDGNAPSQKGVRYMHKFAKQIMECVKTKVEAMGIDNIEGQHLEELEKWTEIAKNIVCYDKDYNIVEAMKEAENEYNMRAIEMYEDYPERRYYDNYRYKTSGRFAPKGKGSYMPRRGYDEPPYYHMTPEMYREHEPKYYRDMDKESRNVMYYTEPVRMDSRYENAKRGYEESKAMHNGNTPEDKQAKMKDLEAYMKEISEDVTKLISDATPEEKSIVKTKMQTLMQKF